MPRPLLARLAAGLAGAALLVAAALPAAAQTKTLKIVAHADVKILDPTFTTAYITRNFGYMVYDMPFGLDEKGQPKPQMVDKWTTSKDGKLWTFTLRPNLKFSDGTAVTSTDVVASMQRWTSKDSIGRAMIAISKPEWKAIDEKTFTLTLQEPFGMVLEGMAKPSGFPPVVMPERIAKLPTTAPLTEVMGSGPFMFKRDEWVPGNKAVFVRNPHYVARSDPGSGAAGSKKPHFDRIEWLYIPDANSAAAALKKGEVDYIEQVPPDYINTLRADPNIKLVPSGSWQGWMVMNQLHPPFNNPKVRQAVLKAVNQDKFMAAMGYPKDLRVTSCATFFICGGPNETFAGADPWRTPDVAKAKQLLAESGYKGEKVVIIDATDQPIVHSQSLLTLENLKKIGVNAEIQAGDWGTLITRRAVKEPPEKGGWNIFHTWLVGPDMVNPAVNFPIRGTGEKAWFGWPTDAKMEQLREAWFEAKDAASAKKAADAVQQRAFEFVPIIPTGQFILPTAYRSNISGLIIAPINLLWNVEKK